MKRPFVISLTLGLVLLTSILWAAFGGLVAAHAHPALPDSPIARLGMAIMSFAIAGMLLALWVFLSKRSRWAYWLAVVLMSGMILAAFLDEVGLADMVFLGLCALQLVLLLTEKRWFLGRPA